MRIPLAVFVVLATAVAPAGSSSPAELDASRPEHAGAAWFVEFTSPPAAEGTSRTILASEHAAFRAGAAKVGVRIRERASFKTLWNGLSVEIAPRDLPALARVQGVKALYPVETVELPEVSALESPELATALAMIGADAAQSELGLDGAGVRVAVMDTGIDYHHPDLGGCFGPGCRVETGWDFVGNSFNADPLDPGYNPTPVPDADPDDCYGHGTHVAGIVGAGGNSRNGGALGVAPGVTFGAYKVFGCAGFTRSDIMIAAMERALADGMQVLNMSIGAPFRWPQHPTAQASTRLVNSGVTVVASIGNSGGTGLYSATGPGVGEKVIGVASFGNSHADLPVFTISPDGTAIGYGTATGAPAAPTSGSLSMARTGTPSAVADACFALPAGSLNGRAVLIRRAQKCTPYQQALNAQNAGAAAVVLYNNSSGFFIIATVEGSPAVTIPVVLASSLEGVRINNLLEPGPVTMTWTGEHALFVNPNGGMISPFSSYGLSPDLDLKPDIGAPGGLIRSTYPLEQGGYAMLSGTSMSAPHVAGAVALLLEARPSTSSQAVRGILQNSADPRPWRSGLDLLDNVHRQGAGMLDIPGAVLGTTSLSPEKLALGESEAGPSTRTLTIHNGGTAERMYALTHVPAMATGPNTTSPSFFGPSSSGSAGVVFSPPDVTVPPGGSARVEVSITANAALPERSQYGGYIVATSDDGKVSRVPYSGLKGDYQSMQALTPTAANYPWLAKLAPTKAFVNKPSGATYSLQGDDVPYFVVRLGHQARRLRLTVMDAASGKNWHRALDLQYLGRNSDSPPDNRVFTFSWDGVTARGNGQQVVVPNGDYRVRLDVLKALGNEDNLAHSETWTSPVITLARP